MIIRVIHSSYKCIVKHLGKLGNQLLTQVLEQVSVLHESQN